MAKKKVVKKVKVRKRKWFDVALPELFGGQTFTQALSDEAENLIGKNIKVSLGDVLKPNKRHITATLKIVEIKTSVAHTTIKRLDVSEPYLLRKSRRNSKVSIKVVDTSKDGHKIDYRLCAIGKGHALTSAKREIRKKLTEFAQNKIKEMNVNGLIMDSINGTIFSEIKKELNKIHPIKSVEMEKLIVMS